jgi:hypothetical protein
VYSGLSLISASVFLFGLRRKIWLNRVSTYPISPANLPSKTPLHSEPLTLQLLQWLLRVLGHSRIGYLLLILGGRYAEEVREEKGREKDYQEKEEVETLDRLVVLQLALSTDAEFGGICCGIRRSSPRGSVQCVRPRSSASLHRVGQSDLSPSDAYHRNELHSSSARGHQLG